MFQDLFSYETHGYVVKKYRIDTKPKPTVGQFVTNVFTDCILQKDISPFNKGTAVKEITINDAGVVLFNIYRPDRPNLFVRPGYNFYARIHITVGDSTFKDILGTNGLFCADYNRPLPKKAGFRFRNCTTHIDSKFTPDETKIFVADLDLGQGLLVLDTDKTFPVSTSIIFDEDESKADVTECIKYLETLNNPQRRKKRKLHK